MDGDINPIESIRHLYGFKRLQDGRKLFFILIFKKFILNKLILRVSKERASILGYASILNKNTVGSNIKFFLNSDVFLDYYFTVIDTDYKSYAITCGSLKVVDQIEENVIIFSRKRSPDDKLIMLVKNVLKNKYSIDPTNFKKTYQNDCVKK